MDEVEEEVAKWRQDVSRLVGACPKAVEEKGRIQPVWSIMPDVIQDVPSQPRVEFRGLG